MKWEYLIIFYSFESAEWRQILNDETSVLKFTQSVIFSQAGMNGWELVTSTNTPSNSDYIVEQEYIFKRPARASVGNG